MKQKMFISAYACEPGLGSEIGVGWHWVLELSREFELWVLTRESNRGTIEPWIAEHPEYSGIHFLYHDLPKWARFWKRGLRGVRTYYVLWQKTANRIVRRSMKEHGITLFHHVTYGNVMWPVSSYGSKQTFIWGPVGGLETIPADFSCHYGRKQRIVEAIRRALVWKTRHSPGFIKRCRRADLIFCKTQYTLIGIPARYRHKAVLMTDVAPETSIEEQEARSERPNTTFITVGRLDAWRGFDLAIEALAKMADSDARLLIVGKGADKERLQSLAEVLGVAERVDFVGKVDMERYKELMGEASVVLNPALKEGAVTVAFDAMAMGKPLIAVDTTGYTRYFSPEYSKIIPRENREKLVTLLAEAMQRLTDPDLRQRMGNAAEEAALKYSWAQHGQEIITTIYQFLSLREKKD